MAEMQMIRAGALTATATAKPQAAAGAAVDGTPAEGFADLLAQPVEPSANDAEAQGAPADSLPPAVPEEAEADVMVAVPGWPPQPVKETDAPADQALAVASPVEEGIVPPSLEAEAVAASAAVSAPPDPAPPAAAPVAAAAPDILGPQAKRPPVAGPQVPLKGDGAPPLDVLAQAVAAARPDAGTAAERPVASFVPPVPVPAPVAVDAAVAPVERMRVAELKVGLPDAQAPAVDVTLRSAPTAAPSPASAAPAASVNTQSPQWLSQTTEILVHQAGEGANRAKLVLHPAELGTVRVDLHLGADRRVDIVMTADTPAARDLMEQNAHQLRERLAEQGLNPGQLDVDLRQQQSSASDARQQQGRADGAGESGAGDVSEDGGAQERQSAQVGLLDAYA